MRKLSEAYRMRLIEQGRAEAAAEPDAPKPDAPKAEKPKRRKEVKADEPEGTD